MNDQVIGTEKTTDEILEEQVKLIEEYSKAIPGFAELFEAIMIPDDQFDEAARFILIQYENEMTDSASKKKNKLLFKIIKEADPEIGEKLDQIAASVRENLEGKVIESKIDFVEQILSMTKRMIEEPILDREEVYLPIELAKDGAKYPVYAHFGDDGADIYAAEEVLIPAAPLPMAQDGNDDDDPSFYTLDEEVAVNVKIVPTGLKVAIPEGYVIEIKPRSGLSRKTYLRISNSPGTIDNGYLDEIGVICENTGYVPLLIRKGDRIAQMVIRESPKIRFAPVKSVAELSLNRGGGYGHSGVR